MTDQLNMFNLMSKKDKDKITPVDSEDWKWSFKDYPKRTNGLKVFSCFACGGGSTMGYKLAGCEVLGCVEIDPKMNETYIKNHHPKYNYLMDIREFNKLNDLPEELYNLDILDGSPPCTTFSTAGDREKTWGKTKKFREGQKEQTLDDLSFVFIQTAKKLRPKVVIMENVEGLLLGEAYSYVKRIYHDFKQAGYKLHHWLLKGELMGVPQTRHRVFFIGIRKDIDINPASFNMEFNYKPITYGEIKDGKGKPPSAKAYKLLTEARPDESLLKSAHERLFGKASWFNHCICTNERVMPTIPAGHDCLWDYENKTHVSSMDIIHAQTFPEDYKFESEAQVAYICGMSVPPVMIKRIVNRIIEQDIFHIDEKDESGHD